MTRFDDENIRAIRGMSLVGRLMPEDSKTRATSVGSSGKLWYSIITNGARKGTRTLAGIGPECAMDNDDTMHARLAAALQEARAMSDRGWRPPPDATLAEAVRLLALLEPLGWRPPEIQVTPGGEISVEWEAG